MSQVKRDGNQRIPDQTNFVLPAKRHGSKLNKPLGSVENTDLNVPLQLRLQEKMAQAQAKDLSDTSNTGSETGLPLDDGKITKSEESSQMVGEPCVVETMDTVQQSDDTCERRQNSTGTCEAKLNAHATELAGALVFTQSWSQSIRPPSHAVTEPYMPTSSNILNSPCLETSKSELCNDLTSSLVDAEKQNNSVNDSFPSFTLRQDLSLNDRIDEHEASIGMEWARSSTETVLSALDVAYFKVDHPSQEVLPEPTGLMICDMTSVNALSTAGTADGAEACAGRESDTNSAHVTCEAPVLNTNKQNTPTEQSSETNLSIKRRRTKGSKFTRIKRRKVDVESSGEATGILHTTFPVVSQHGEHESIMTGDDSPVCAQDTESSESHTKLFRTWNKTDSVPSTIQSQQSTQSPSIPHVAELRVDDIVLPFDDEDNACETPPVPVKNKAMKVKSKGRKKCIIAREKRTVDRNIGDIAQTDSAVDVQSKKLSVESLILPFDEPSISEKSPQNGNEQMEKKHSCRSKSRRSRIFSSHEIEASISSDCGVVQDECTSVIDSDMITLPFDDTQPEKIVVAMNHDVLAEEPILVVEEKKPSKKRRGRKSADFEIMNAPLVLLSPNVQSPSEAEYLPLGQPSSRRSKRLRRKSIEIFKAETRKRKLAAQTIEDMSESELEEDTRMDTETQTKDVDTNIALSSTELHTDVLSENQICASVIVEGMCDSSPCNQVTGDQSSIVSGVTTQSFSTLSNDNPPTQCTVTADEQLVEIPHTSSTANDLNDLPVESTNDSNFDKNKGSPQCVPPLTPETSPSGRALRRCRSKTDPQEKAAPVKRMNGKKQKPEPSIEEVYLNKLWRTQMPVEKAWETIYEEPLSKKSGLEYLSKKKLKRTINSEEFYTKPRLKRRRQKAVKLGWKPLTAKRDEQASILLTDKLSELEKELDSAAVPSLDVLSERSESLVMQSTSQEDLFYTPARTQSVSTSSASDTHQLQQSSSLLSSSSDDSQLFKTPLKDPSDLVKAKNFQGISVLESPDSGMREEFIPV